MKPTMMTGLMAALVMAAGIVTTDANATVLDLGHPTIASHPENNIGTQDRSIVIDATSDFSITSAGIRLDPLQGGATNINVEIYNVLPNGGVGTRGSLLATNATSITDAGLDFYDIAIDFTFLAGNRYDIAFNSIAPDNWGIGNNFMEFYDFNFPDPTYSVGGVLNVIDGSQGGTYTNAITPHVRLNIVDQQDVPEPAALVIFGLGLLGLGLASQRRKNNV